MAFLRLLLPLLFMASTSLSSAQNGKVRIDIIVTNFEKVPQPGEKIILKSTTKDKEYEGVSDANGKIKLMVNHNDTYQILIKAVGDRQKYSEIKVPKVQAGSKARAEIEVYFEMSKSFTLDNVYFDTGKSSLRTESYKELNELVDLMKRKPTLKIEIGGHTDNVGNDNDNLELSQARADAVKQFLIKKGIEANRITAVGYGEALPIADNGTAEGRQKNRRTEVQIID